jgi:hypothetical protein
MRRLEGNAVTQYLSDFMAKQRAAADRKARRTEKGMALGLRKPRPQKTFPISRLSTKGAIKEKIVRILGLLDRKYNGPLCRYGLHCPAYKRLGVHNGDSACHLEPAKRGDAVRLNRKAVVWACHSVNFWEKEHRGTTVDRVHNEAFGIERMTEVRALERMEAHFSESDLRSMLQDLRKELGEH